MAGRAAETRKRILAAADELFYGEGILNVGVDAIAAKAGITKRTLYYHFPSKDELIAAYLDARDAPTLARYQDIVSKTPGAVRDRMRATFEYLEQRAGDPKWKGCGFARAVAELAGLPGHPAQKIASRHKHAFEAWLMRSLEAEGVPDAATRAKQIMILLDGAVTQILIHHDVSYAKAAGAAIDALIAA